MANLSLLTLARANFVRIGRGGAYNSGKSPRLIAMILRSEPTVS
jgi:hypothetical protein